MTLGIRIANARNEAGFTQQKLADAVGRSVHALRKWERDENEPSLELLAKIGEVTGVSVAYLIGCSGENELSEAEKTRAALARIHRRIINSTEGLDLSDDSPRHPGVETLSANDLFMREYGVTDEELYMLRHASIVRRDGSRVVIRNIQGAIALLEAIRRMDAMIE